MQTITVREYARLTTDLIEPSLDAATISPSAFDWLCKLYSEFKKSGASLLHFEGRRCLKLDNYVGVLETPCGTCIEILPKHREELTCVKETRKLLRTMITTAYDVKPREADQAPLELYQDLPLSEWVMRCFLDALDVLVQRGIRSDYERIEEVEPFLRGQLDLVRQLRQAPGRQHLFHIRYDVLSPNRPENRLLKSALMKVARHVRDPAAWRLAQELREWLHEIPESKHIGPDFHRWQSDRLMANYTAVRPWCKLILNHETPLALSGDWQGLSLLFPMEKLFERYVAAYLRKEKCHDVRMIEQSASEHLCSYSGHHVFSLKPDIILIRNNITYILDAKWKMLDQLNSKANFGISQADMYQMFAYGHKYMKGKGDMALIYPCHAGFDGKSLEPFQYDSELRLWIVGFDLKQNCFSFFN